MTPPGDAAAGVVASTDPAPVPPQGDVRVRALLARIGVLDRVHQQERARAERAEAELARRDGEPAGAAESGAPLEGFGARVERVLRVAEQEAADARTSASREAAALLDRTRREAAAHRHEVEQALAARRTDLDGRERGLDERERVVREEVERTLADARSTAEEIVREAQADGERRRDDAARRIRERHDEAERELARLTALHDDVRGDLGRLLASLSGQLPAPAGGADADRADVAS